MLVSPIWGTTRLDTTETSTANAGVTLTGDGVTAHVKGPWSQLIASSAFDAYGISVLVGSTARAASVDIRRLVDIGIGAASSEIVIIANLEAGGSAEWGDPSCQPAHYVFPIFIPAGTRIAGRCQGQAISPTVQCQVRLYSTPIGPCGWTGSTVTTYGADTANSRGVLHTHGNASYPTATEIVSSTSRPTRYLQVGVGMSSDTTGNTKRGLIRIGVGSTPNYIASDLPWAESTTVESVQFETANFILSRMLLDIPSATSLRLGAMMNAAGEARSFILYGVD
jgi:hypothetical protein